MLHEDLKKKLKWEKGREERRRKREERREKKMDYRQTIIDSLTTLKKRELANKAPFKARAYQTVIQQLEQMTEPVTYMKQITDLKGMGEKIREKIEEIIKTGELQSAIRAVEIYSLHAHDELQGVYGIGPSKAKELIEEGITSVALLRTAIHKNPSLLNDKQQIGLTYYEDLLERIPREEMKEHEDYLLRESPLSAELVGSYRRGLLNSGDIDVLLRVPPHQTPKDTKNQFYQFVQKMIDSNYIEQILALGEHKCMAICRLTSNHKARRLDLLVTPDEEYSFSLLYFTGSDRFNVAFRQHALSKGYTLNEHRLQRIAPFLEDDPVPYMRTEHDIFHFIGLLYTEPSQRLNATSLRFPPLIEKKRLVVRRPVLAKDA